VNNILPAASLLLLVACGSSPSEQARKLRQTQQSWKATVQLTKELRERDAVPAEYAEQTLAAAEQELDKARRKAKQGSP
jgi:outer membrane biogenesis lipoprotein LolB